MAEKKPPRPFRRRMKERRYLRRIRNRVYLETDRSFLDSVTDRIDGTVGLARELTGDERKRLIELVKEAGKNRGAVRTGKLVILAVIAVAVILFNVLIKDSLAQRTAESALESVFRAEATMTGVVFRPFAGELSFASLTVADRHRPMSNLFELGRGRLSLDTWLLLRGNVVIRDLTVEGLAFGTPRRRSGALAEREEADAGRTEPAASVFESAGDAFSLEALGLPSTLDASAFVNRYVGLFRTPTQVESVVGAGLGYVSETQREIALLTAEGVEIAVRIQTFAETDFAAIRSVDRALQLLEESNALVGAATTYRADVRQFVDETREGARGLIDDAAGIPASAADDARRLVAEIPQVRAEGRDFLVGLIEPHLRGYLGVWYDRILLGYGYFERLRDREHEPVSPRATRVGRLVDFGTRQHPAFVLQAGFFSATAGRTRELVLQSVSSDPDLTGEPARLSYRDEGRTLLALGAIVDQRSSADAVLSLSVTSSGEPVSVARGLEALEINRLDAVTDLDLSFLLDSSRRVSGAVALGADRIALIGTPDAGSIGELVRDVLAGPSPLEASFSYSVSPDGRIGFAQGATNLDERFAGAVQQRIDATVAAFRARVEDEVEGFLEPYLVLAGESVGEIIDVRESAEELLALARDREAAAAALQRRAAGVVDSIRATVEAEARDRLDAARAEAEAAAREQAERARAEAEEAARREAERIRDSIRLPGF